MTGSARAATTSTTIQLTIVAPFTVVKQADLAFGNLIASPAAGSVIINPDSGTRSTSGGVIGASGSYNPARFVTAGSPNQHITIKITPKTITLNRIGGGASMPVSKFTRNNTPPNSARLDANGNYTFTVGATLDVAANQMAGSYTGTFDVEVSYQ